MSFESLLLKLNFPIYFIKFFFGLFFLIYLSLTDFFYGKISNKLLILMFLIGVLINILFEREHFLTILLTFIFTFIFAYIFWELSFLNSGDVKLLPVISLYLPYQTQINPMVSLAIYSFLVFSLFFVAILIRKLVKKELKLKVVLNEIINYLRRINYLYFLITLFTFSVLLFYLNINIFLSIILIFLVFALIDLLIKNYELDYKTITLIVFIFSLFFAYKFQLIFDPLFWKHFLILTFLIVFIRVPLYILSYFASIKVKRIEELKINDKLARVPVKVGNSFQLLRLIPYNLFSIYFIKKHAIDDYDPSLGLQKENINKIKRFFKMNHIKKVEIFEEIPFVPIFLFAYLLFYLIYFITFYNSL
ncbi:MAG: prepilin peptidase [Nanoarchaeota archaeon]